jgi:hypothetical protein
MQRYDVALWLVWPSLFPDVVDWVEAENAFAAVVAMMQVSGVSGVARGAAYAADGSILYRGSGIRLVCFSSGEVGLAETDHQTVS